MMDKGFNTEYSINQLHASTVFAVAFEYYLAIYPIDTRMVGSTASAYHNRVPTRLCIWRILVADNTGELSVSGAYCTLAPYVGLFHAWGAS